MAELFRRGSIWYAWIRGFGPDRRTRVRKCSTKCTDRKAAEAFARAFERESADPEGAKKNAATLSDALELLIRDGESKANAKPPKASRARAVTPDRLASSISKKAPKVLRARPFRYVDKGLQGTAKWTAQDSIGAADFSENPPVCSNSFLAGLDLPDKVASPSQSFATRRIAR
jgi:hypothetical protein